MGAKVTEDFANKDRILESAGADKYRGVYIPWGGVHYYSMSLGACCGAALFYAVWVIEKLL